jgi:predicted transposase YbfD/YdcC
MVSSCKNLSGVETLTKEMSVPMRRELGLGGRVPDTTLRDAVVETSPDVMRSRLHLQIKAARHRKSLEPFGLPFGMAHFDGKGTSLPSWDNLYAQRNTYDDKKNAYGLLRTITCCLASAKAKVCIDAVPLPADTNEVGYYREVLRQELAIYGRGLFELVSYDAGGCSEENADFTVEQGLDYLFSIKDNQPGILEKMEFLLGGKGPEQSVAQTQNVVGGKGGKNVVTRRLWIVEKQPLFRWNHARTFLRVDSTTTDQEGNVLAHETRYFLCSKERSELTDEQWLSVVRRMWAVENNIHHTLDVAFQEDKHPWIEASPQGALALLILRRIALNMLMLFRSVTCTSDEKRTTPWADLLRWMRNALLLATESDFDDLRKRVAVSS